jgi:hypothetical protein
LTANYTIIANLSNPSQVVSYSCNGGISNGDALQGKEWGTGGTAPAPAPPSHPTAPSHPGPAAPHSPPGHGGRPCRNCGYGSPYH